jgi:hypothetical protein
VREASIGESSVARIFQNVCTGFHGRRPYSHRVGIPNRRRSGIPVRLRAQTGPSIRLVFRPLGVGIMSGMLAPLDGDWPGLDP